MRETVQAGSTVNDFDFWMGSWKARNRRETNWVAAFRRVEDDA